MIKRFFNALNQPLGRVGALIVLLALLSGAVWGIAQTQKTPQQPIDFPHNIHVGVLHIPCLYCHPGALRGPSPGLPTETKCWGCHQQLDITKTSPKLVPLVQAVQNNTPLQWVPVAWVPDFVHFVHRPHIAAGLNCEDCHGGAHEALAEAARAAGDEPIQFGHAVTMGRMVSIRKKAPVREILTKW